MAPSDASARLKRIMWPLELAEGVVHYAVAVLLVSVSGVVLYYTAHDFVTADQIFPDGVTAAVNGVLFVVIVMEILRTVMAHFEQGGFQLKPFLVIGIVSCVRHILTVGAQLSLAGQGSTEHLHNTLLELSVNAGVVLALVVALALVRYGKPPEPGDEL